ncbi:extracellular solute-binding protein [Lactococcus nasutitermitis]|uniref:Extracellular solute-binding protein n=1 Tax=Lactococcus nasutitermitis TaxID=1652957 RepID=A0ABV9JIN0_9LACT|nr:extracellular solute-binding protein [Lactococcus nasutitermitis]
MKTWKKVALGGASVMAIATLAACGNSASSSKNSSTNFKGQTLKIGTWAGSPQETTAMKKQIKNFEKKTGAKVVNKVYTNINQQLPADFSAHTAPDVFYVDSSMFPFYNKEGVLQPLKSSDGYKFSDFYKTQLDAFKSGSKVYGIPKDMSTLAYLVNLDMLKKSGVSQSDIPTSYEGLVKWLPGIQAKLDAAYGKGKVSAFGYDQDLARLFPIVSASNPSFIKDKGNGNSNLSSSKTLSNLDILTQLTKTGATATPQSIGSSNDGEAFGTGKVLMIDDGNWDYQTLQQQYKMEPGKNFAILPMFTYNGKKETMSYTVGWAESKQSKEQSLANKWIQYVTGKAGMTIDADNTGVLPTRSDLKAKVINGDKQLEVFANEVGYATPWQYGTSLVDVQTSFNNFLPSALSGKTSLSSAMKKADAQANTAIKNGN